MFSCRSFAVSSLTLRSLIPLGIISQLWYEEMFKSCCLDIAVQTPLAFEAQIGGRGGIITLTLGSNHGAWTSVLRASVGDLTSPQPPEREGLLVSSLQMRKSRQGDEACALGLHLLNGRPRR